MSTKVAVGVSRSPDPIEAGRDAAFAAKVNLSSEEIHLALLFSTANFDLTETLKGVARVVKSAPLVGLSSPAIICPQGIYTNAVVVALIRSDSLKFATSVVYPVTNGSELAKGRELAQKACRFLTSGRQAFSLFCDNLISQPAQLLSGVQEVLGGSFPVCGALSADDGHSGKTYQFFDNQLLSYAATGILWGGSGNCSIGSSHGCKPLGRPFPVTKFQGNKIISINNKPAISIYENYFEKLAEELKTVKLSRISLLYPLGFYVQKEDGYILRNVVNAQQDGSLICQGQIPESSHVRLMIGTKDSLIQSAKEAAMQAKTGLELNKKSPAFALVSSSYARLKLLGRNCGKELSAIKEVLGSDVPVVGFYGFAEFAPLSSLDYKGKSYILNETLNILAIGT